MERRQKRKTRDKWELIWEKGPRERAVEERVEGVSGEGKG